ncbi:MAG TPA: hypothetical protein DD618_02955 [Acholeplasmatales bacterium]|nr:hypothetical protein [Acholeplasmatales bacterium]
MNKEIVSNVGLLVFWVLMLIVCYLFTFSIDKSLYKKYRLVHIDDRPTMKIKKIRWLFTRFDKTDPCVIFKTTFIFQLITVIFFIVIIASNVFLYFVNDTVQSIIIIVSTTCVVTFTIFLSRKEEKLRK